MSHNNKVRAANLSQSEKKSPSRLVYKISRHDREQENRCRVDKKQGRGLEVFARRVSFANNRRSDSYGDCMLQV